MATVAASKKKKTPAKKSTSTVGRVANAVANKAKGKHSVAGIVGAIAAPIALIAIGYGLTRLDARLGGKVMGMVLDRFNA